MIKKLINFNLIDFVSFLYTLSNSLGFALFISNTLLSVKAVIFTIVINIEEIIVE